MALETLIDNPFLQNSYVHAISILIVFSLLAYCSVLFLRFFVKRVAERTTTDLDDHLITKISKPVFFLILALGFRIALSALPLPERVYLNGQHFFNTLLIICLFFIFYNLTQVLLDAWGRRFAQRTRSTIDQDILPLFQKAIRVTIVVFSVLFILSEWGIDITGLLAGVGIAGLVIGLALKDSLSNIFGGVSIILDKAFRVGDIIKTSDGDMGTVMDIGLRSTRIKTWDNELLVIPNGQLANAKIQNFKQPDESTRAVIQFGVTYGSDIEEIKTIVAKALEKLPHVLNEGKRKPKVYFMGFGDSALNLQATFWVDEYMKKFGTKEKAMCLIYETLNKHKIDFAFPTRTIYLNEAPQEKKKKHGTKRRTPVRSTDIELGSEEEI